MTPLSVLDVTVGSGNGRLASIAIHSANDVSMFTLIKPVPNVEYNHLMLEESGITLEQMARDGQAEGVAFKAAIDFLKSECSESLLAGVHGSQDIQRFVRAAEHYGGEPLDFLQNCAKRPGFDLASVAVFAHDIGAINLPPGANNLPNVDFAAIAQAVGVPIEDSISGPAAAFHATASGLSGKITQIGSGTPHDHQQELEAVLREKPHYRGTIPVLAPDPKSMQSDLEVGAGKLLPSKGGVQAPGILAACSPPNYKIPNGDDVMRLRPGLEEEAALPPGVRPQWRMELSTVTGDDAHVEVRVPAEKLPSGGVLIFFPNHKAAAIAVDAIPGSVNLSPEPPASISKGQLRQPSFKSAGSMSL